MDEKNMYKYQNSMKKFLASISLASVLLGASSVSLMADEGMWLLPLLEKMNGKDMKKKGCKLSPKQIYNADGISLKDAIVQFGGGCTGEIISDEGLLITNHHCGYSHIQALSSIEHNYLQDGFWAMQRSEELPCKDLTVSFLESMTDVTDIVAAAEAAAREQYRDSADIDMRVSEAVAQKQDELAANAQKEYPNCTAIVQQFYNQNLYYLIVYKIYRDVRFVGAPPSSIGKFGADTDNWMWPRHTCDFSMFRVYAGADNEPADYSPENQPLRPKNHLKISLKGVKEGDFTMIMGYPGRTNRFATSAELKAMLAQNDIRIEARTLRQNLMQEDMKADPKVQIQYASKYSGSSNGWKKWQGMKLAFAKLGVLERTENDEKAFMQWVNESPDRQAKYAAALDDIASYTNSNAVLAGKVTWLLETVGNSEIAEAAAIAANCVRSGKREGVDSTALAQAVVDKIAESEFYKDYSLPTDRKITAAMLRLYHEKTDTSMWIIEGYTPEKADEYISQLYANSIFVSQEAASEAILKDGVDVIYEDPAYRFSTDISRAYRHCYAQRRETDAVPFAKGKKAYTAGLLEWHKGEPSYPDANFSMRLTYGSVMGYSPADAVEYEYYTTLEGVMEKDNPASWEFAVPERLKEIYREKDFGPYASKDGKMSACFLSNNDITGGNSGSPIMNARGELIGLAFDGNWESMSSDIMFEPNLQRCISVDIRYVMLIIDKFGGASHLIDEMDIVR